MKYYIYASNDPSTTDNILTYICSINCDHDYRIAIAKHFMQAILDNKPVPYFIELSLEVWFKDACSDLNSLNGLNGLNDLVIANSITLDNIQMSEFYYDMVRRSMSDKCILNELYNNWTVDTPDPLMVVAETDIAATFILQKYPPVEYVMWGT